MTALNEEKGTYVVSYRVNETEVENTVTIGPREFVNNTPRPSNDIKCSDGIYATMARPCTCMVAAQRHRGEDPDNLFPQWFTSKMWLEQYHERGRATLLTDVDIENAKGELDNGDDLQMVPAVIAPRPAGRPKEHKRGQAPWRAAVSKSSSASG